MKQHFHLLWRRSVAFVAIFGLLLGMAPSPSHAEQMWYEPYVQDLYEAGLIDSVAGYQPAQPVNRAQIAKLVALAGFQNLDQYQVSGTQLLTDVESNTWYEKYVLLLFQLGLMQGDKDPVTGDLIYRFRPGSEMNRSEFAMVLFRALSGKNIEQYTPSSANPFSDVDSSAWYFKPVMWAKENGYMTGYQNSDRFGPSDSVLGAQIAKVVSLARANLKFQLIKKAGEMGVEVAMPALDADGDEADDDAGSVGKVEIYPAPKNPSGGLMGAGEEGVDLFSFVIEAESELVLSGLLLGRAGVGDSEDIESLSLYHEGQIIAGPQAVDPMTNDALFSINPGLKLDQGIQTFVVRADISPAAQTGNQHLLYIANENAVDTTLIEAGDFPVSSNTFTIGTGGQEPIVVPTSALDEMADFVITKQGPPASVIEKDSANQELLRAHLSSEDDVMVKKTTVRLSIEDANGSQAEPSAYDFITDIRLVDHDFGNTLAGPIDEASDGTCFDGADADSYPDYCELTFTEDYLVHDSGETLSVQADISQNMALGNKVKATLMFSADELLNESFGENVLPGKIIGNPAVGNWMTVGGVDLSDEDEIPANPVVDTDTELTVFSENEHKDHYVIEGDDEAYVGNVFFRAYGNDDVEINKLTFYNNITHSFAKAPENTNVVEEVVVKYIDENGLEQTSSAPMVNGQAVIQGLSVHVPANGEAEVEFYASIIDDAVYDYQPSDRHFRIGVAVDANNNAIGLEALSDDGESFTTATKDDYIYTGDSYVVAGAPQIEVVDLPAEISEGVQKTLYEFVVAAPSETDIHLNRLPFRFVTHNFSKDYSSETQVTLSEFELLKNGIPMAGVQIMANKEAGANLATTGKLFLGNNSNYQYATVTMNELLTASSVTTYTLRAKVEKQYPDDNVSLRSKLMNGGHVFHVHEITAGKLIGNVYSDENDYRKYNGDSWGHLAWSDHLNDEYDYNLALNGGSDNFMTGFNILLQDANDEEQFNVLND